MRAGGEVGLGGDAEAEEAIAAAGAIFGREEAGQRIGRRQAGGRIDTLEGGEDLPGSRIDAGFDFDIEGFAVVGHRHSGLVVLRAEGDGDEVVAPADAGELKGAPVEIGAELVGDGDALGGRGGGGGVLEIDLVRHCRAGGLDEVACAEAVGTVHGIGILGVDGIGGGAVAAVLIVVVAAVVVGQELGRLGGGAGAAGIEAEVWAE